MNKLLSKYIKSAWLEPLVGCLAAFLIFFVFLHNGLVFFLDLFLPLLLLPWTVYLVKKLFVSHKYIKALGIIIANIVALCMFWLLPVVIFGYLPKDEDPVMDEDESKSFGIYVASYKCINNVVLDSMVLDLDIWTQYSNNYTSYQSKEDIVVKPSFICYSCIIRNEQFYNKIKQVDYGVNWDCYLHKGANGENYIFAEYGVLTSDVKDTIVMHIKKYTNSQQIVDSLTFVRDSKPHVPDWDVKQKTIRRHINRSWKQRFLDRLYYDYFWVHIL